MPINNVGGPGPTGGNPISDAAHEHVATVRHGETVSDVARRHGVETRSLLEANPQLKDAYQTLNAGQEIRLPQVTASADAATPKLYEAASKGKHIPEVTIELARGNTPAPLGDPTTKAVIQGQLSTTQLSETDLAQVQGGVKGESLDDKHKDWIEVQSFSNRVTQPTSSTTQTPNTPAKSSESPALPTEAVNLNYGKIEWTYTPQKPDGTQGTTATVNDSHDRYANAPSLSEAELPQVQGGAQDLRNPIAAQKSQKWQHGVNAGKILPQNNLDTTPSIDRTTPTIKDSAAKEGSLDADIHFKYDIKANKAG